jgi:hypothetical protein
MLPIAKTCLDLFYECSLPLEEIPTRVSPSITYRFPPKRFRLRVKRYKRSPSSRMELKGKNYSIDLTIIVFYIYNV